ncbi:MAG TPA: MerR family transcriptional regulator [Acidobacteriaceae bacterium]|jgi:DNA-binding transcriptional MerR regulator|nr:MerR family transcriptional regulator [Acidobacteriaceae bacterium]
MAMPKHAAQPRPPREVVIPDKLYFRIGDVAKLCGVETYVLRFWETEFPQMRPNKSGTGQRLYRKRDVELALKVRRLLHDEGYTIAGARQVLVHEAGSRVKGPQLPLIEKVPPTPAVEAKIQKLRGELRDLLGILSTAPARRGQPHIVEPLETQPGPKLFE